MLAWLALVAALLAPSAASAHSFGTPYVLPIPFWMYAYGAAATLIVTFAVLGWFASAPAARGTPPVAPAEKPGRPLPGWLVGPLRILGLALLLFVIVGGFVGSADPSRNGVMPVFWAFFLLGLAYLTIFVGNLYAVANPWRTLATILGRLGLDLTRPRLRWPRWFGTWPALLLYVGLLWVELFAPPEPMLLAILVCAYAALMLAGAWVFGIDRWLAGGDLFSVYFDLVGRLAPVEYFREPDDGWRVRLRAPFAGALSNPPAHLSTVVFILLMLSSTTYDAIHGTQFWIGLYWTNLMVLLEPLWAGDLRVAQDMLMGGFLVYRQAGLFVFPFLYLAFYVVVLVVVRVIAGPVPVRRLIPAFALSLMPIAIAYSFTHYFPFLLVQTATIGSILGDPFGLGWRLFGIEPVAVPTDLDMGAIWHAQVAVIIAGHVVSVVLAHRAAQAIFPTRRQVNLSQAPLLLLMVAYTTIGLWILYLPLGAGIG